MKSSPYIVNSDIARVNYRKWRDGSWRDALLAGVIVLGVGEQHIYGYECPLSCGILALSNISEEKRTSVSLQHRAAFRTARWQDLVADDHVNVISIVSFDDDLQ